MEWGAQIREKVEEESEEVLQWDRSLSQEMPQLLRQMSKKLSAKKKNSKKVLKFFLKKKLLNIQEEKNLMSSLPRQAELLKEPWTIKLML